MKLSFLIQLFNHQKLHHNMRSPKFWTENWVPTRVSMYVFPLSRLFSAFNLPSVVSLPTWRPVPSSMMTTGASGSTVVPSSIGVSLSPSGAKVTSPLLLSSPTWASPSPAPTTLRSEPLTLLRTATIVGFSLVGLTSEVVPAVVLTTPWVPSIAPLTFSALVSIVATGLLVFVSMMTATVVDGAFVSSILL